MTWEIHLAGAEIGNQPGVPARRGRIIPNLCWGGTVGTSTFTKDILFGIPFFLPETCRVDRIFLDVSTGAASDTRIGLYDDLNGYPNNLIKDSASLSSAVSGTGLILSIGLVLPRGLYWGAFVTDTTAGAAFRTWAVGLTALPWLGFTSGTDVTYKAAISAAFVYAALPATFTGGATLATSPWPKIVLMAGLGGDTL